MLHNLYEYIMIRKEITRFVIFPTELKCGHAWIRTQYFWLKMPMSYQFRYHEDHQLTQI